MGFKKIKIVDVKGGLRESVDAGVIIEEPLSIIVDNKELVTVMRTPGSDKQLAAGFLVSEGYIADVGDIQMITLRGGETSGNGNTVNIKLKSGLLKGTQDRAYEVRSGCGICGQKKIDDLFREACAIKSFFKVKIAEIYRMPGLMRESQPLSKRTRGAHAAALFTKDAGMVACCEDVGRHNALDKLIGHSLLEGIALDDKVLLLSGRASYEMMAKTLRARISFVACVSAPSSLAVEIAEKGDIALCGIVRGDTLKIYTRFDDFIE